MPPLQKAFTLIELSIVLVVIGLIVAGVLSGQTLVRQAQFRSVLSDVGKYRVAVNVFRSTYDASPGDMANASSYWSSAYNGNGDATLSDIFKEGANVWQHLTLAGLLSGSYPGSNSTATTNLDIGYHVPAANLRSAGWHMYHLDPPRNNNPRLEIGAIRTSDRPVVNVMSGPEALAFDTKTDDGVPSSGKVVGDIYGYTTYTGGSWSGASCYSGTAYLLTGTSAAANACRLGFLDVWR